MLVDVWLTICDDRSCTACNALNGQEWPHGSDHPRPTLHPNCRCSIITETRADEGPAIPPVIIPDPEPPDDDEDSRGGFATRPQSGTGGFATRPQSGTDGFATRPHTPTHPPSTACGQKPDPNVYPEQQRECFTPTGRPAGKDSPDACTLDHEQRDQPPAASRNDEEPMHPVNPVHPEKTLPAIWSEPITARLSAANNPPDRSELTFEAVTFRAEYPNANCYRFRDADLPAFASSFAGVPFLRDHDLDHIDARGGTVQTSRLEGRDLVQQVQLTVPRDIEAFAHGQMDRFSVSWYYTGVTCSICGQDWLNSDCPHWPGRRYQSNSSNPSEPSNPSTVLCELIFENPRGKEVSAVNAPAVEGTHVRTILAQLSALKGTPPMDEPTTGAPNGAPQTPAAPTAAAAAAAAFLQEQRAAVLDYRLQSSGLPAPIQNVIREGLPANWAPADLTAAIDRQRAALAALQADQVITGHPAPRDGRVTGMLDSLDRAAEALSALIENRPPAHGIPRLSGLKEAYFIFSGDRTLTGKFLPDQVGLANVNSTTMASIVANAMNKIIVNEFQSYPRWWAPIVTVENFGSLQTVKWITLGGIPELPTVAEGAAYTELTWDDSYESSTWVKKGGYIGITLEAVDKDDVSRLRSAPRALAQSAWLTLGKSISAIFTTASGLGPTLTDTGTLFNATAVSTPGGHANLGTSALSTTTWQAAKLAMRKQAELNSGERLGALTSPRYLLVPPDLENTALTILASEGLPGTANNDVNPDAIGNTFDARMDAARRRIIVVDLWTDTNNWAAAADPRMYPTIGLGFRWGETPEIFSVTDPNSGLMFTNDVMPFKSRWFYACGPVDFRGLYKANVT